MRRLFTALALAMVTCSITTTAIAQDQETAQHVAANLRNSGMMKDYSVGVKAKDGVVWLSGKVTSQGQMTSAMNVARQTPGVDQVISKLSIEPAAAAATAQASGAANTGYDASQTSGVSLSESLLGPSAMKARQASGQRPAAANSAVQANRQMPRTGAGFPVYAPGEVPLGLAPNSAGGWATASATPRAVAKVPTSTPQMSQSPAMMQQMPGQMPGEMAQMQPTPRPFAPAMASMAGMGHGPGRVPYGAMNAQPIDMAGDAGAGGGAPIPAYVPGTGGGIAPARYDSPHMPGYAWPSYAAYPNYGALTYPRQYSPTAWPFIGPFYPYPQVPLGWRKVSLEWDDGWWFLDFDDRHCSH